MTHYEYDIRWLSLGL